MLKTDIGNIAEDSATKFLISQGVIILVRNYKALPYGEIDIIVLDGNTLVFVEVKFRKTTKFAKAEETITKSKISKITNAANIFLQENTEYDNYECRFDVIAINNSNINWIKNAFAASEQ